MTLLRAQAALCVMLFSSVAWSQESTRVLPDWYQIEIAVFAHEPADIDAQFWDLALKAKLPEGAIQLGTFSQPQPDSTSAPITPAADGKTNRPPGSPVALILRPDLASSLNNLNRLSLARGYRLLVHQRWLQQLPADSEQPSIRIQGGALLDETVFPDEQFELDGSIMLTRARYLHINTDLYLTLAPPPNWKPANRAPKAVLDALASVPPSLQSPAPEARPPEWLTVNLQQKRRMRSNELHYLDHPLFGMLINITPYAPAVQAAIEGSDLLATNMPTQRSATADPETPSTETKTNKTNEPENAPENH